MGTKAIPQFAADPWIYRFVDNWRSLARVQSILHYLQVRTLAFKRNISVGKVFRRKGYGLCITVAGKDGKQDREVRFSLNQDWSKNREAFQRGSRAEIDQLSLSARLRTRSKQANPCCVCEDGHRGIRQGKYGGLRLTHPVYLLI